MKLSRMILIVVVAALASATFSSSAIAAPGCTTHPERQKCTEKMLSRLKLINYYPKDAGWTLMWSRFPKDEMNSDFAAMRKMGANSVRIIIQVSAIGYPNPTPTGLSELSQIISMADSHNLTVQLTLFDWFGGWSEIGNSTTWARAILSPYKNDPRISFVELKNEIDVTQSQQINWAKNMLPIVKDLAGTLPVTLSLPGNAPSGALASIKSDFPTLDFYDVHDYGSVTSQLASDKSLVAPVPLYVGEAGHSTGSGGSPSNPSLETDQANFFTDLNATTKSLGLPLASPWAWSDFTDGSLTWVSSNSSEYRFGLLRTDGSQKPAFAIEKAAFKNKT